MGDSPVPQFHFAKVTLSRTAMEYRTSLNETSDYPVSQPDANVVLVYLDSYCTTQGNSRLFWDLANTTVLDYDMDYSYVTCFNKGVDKYFDMEKEFGVGERCVRDCQAKLRNKTVTATRLYVAALAVYLLVLLANILLWLPVAAAWAKNLWVMGTRFILTVVGLILVGVARDCLKLHRPLHSGLRRCFDGGNFQVHSAGSGLVACAWVAILLGAGLVALQLVMACNTDGRKRVVRPRRQRQRQRRRRGRWNGASETGGGSTAYGGASDGYGGHGGDGGGCGDGGGGGGDGGGGGGD